MQNMHYEHTLELVWLDLSISIITLGNRRLQLKCVFTLLCEEDSIFTHNHSIIILWLFVNIHVSKIIYGDNTVNICIHIHVIYRSCIIQLFVKREREMGHYNKPSAGPWILIFIVQHFYISQGLRKLLSAPEEGFRTLGTGSTRYPSSCC